MAQELPREHVRVKRGKLTVFMGVNLEDGDDGKALRESTALVFAIDDPDNLRLLRGSDLSLVQDDVPLADQEIADDDIIVAVLKKPNSDEWESPDVSELPHRDGRGEKGPQRTS